VDSIDPIANALSAGFAAGASAVGAQAVKDAYSRLKSALSARYPAANKRIKALERDPASRSEQYALSETLSKSGARYEPGLLRLAVALADAIAEHEPTAAQNAGVDLAHVRALNLIIEDAEGGSSGVRGRDLNIKGDIRIGRARGGSSTDPNF
jgi:hypothetical protein